MNSKDSPDHQDSLTRRSGRKASITSSRKMWATWMGLMSLKAILTSTIGIPASYQTTIAQSECNFCSTLHFNRSQFRQKKWKHLPRLTKKEMQQLIYFLCSRWPFKMLTNKNQQMVISNSKESKNKEHGFNPLSSNVDLRILKERLLVSVARMVNLCCNTRN